MLSKYTVLAAYGNLGGYSAVYDPKQVLLQLEFLNQGIEVHHLVGTNARV